MYYATGLVLKTLPSHSQDDAPLDAFAGTEKDVPELQHGGPGAAEWLRIFPGAARLSTCPKCEEWEKMGKGVPKRHDGLLILLRSFFLL